MKKVLIILGVVFFVGVVYLIYQWSAFEMFAVESELIKEQKVEDKIYRVYYIGGNATTEEVIQLKIEKQGYEYLVNAIEGYNTLKELMVLNDSTVRLILLDSSYSSNTADTVEVLTK